MEQEETQLMGNTKDGIDQIALSSKGERIPLFNSPEAVEKPSAGHKRRIPERKDEVTFQLNYQRVVIEKEGLEVEPPKDPNHVLYYILILHGIGAFLPWNMFITAKDYFEKFKLNEEVTPISDQHHYAQYFMNEVVVASQFPNLMVNWINVFIPVRGESLTNRVLWSTAVEVAVFLVTIALVMTDTSHIPGVFLILTLTSVIILNIAGGIHFNSVCGMGALLPANYVAAICIGANASGLVPAVMSIMSLYVSPGYAVAAIYYFTTAMIVLLACFDTYYALPLIKFYRYHMATKMKQMDHGNKIPPYRTIFKNASFQLINVFFNFFVTLAIFPSVLSAIHSEDENFIIEKKFYVAVTCFLTFVTSSSVGCILSNFFKWPGREHLWILVAARSIFIPFFLFCNYLPEKRTLPVFIHSDWVFLAGSVGMGISAGYVTSLAMMYIPGTVDPQHAPTAGMLASAMAITGAICGSSFSFIFPSWVT